MNARARPKTAPPPAPTTPPGERGVQITAVGLTMEHGNGVPALDDVTLTVEPGRLTAVIGPSGAGKSTLLRSLAGIAPPQEGTVAFAGATGRNDGVGFVPQDDILHSELPLRRTLRYAAALRFAASPVAIENVVADAMHTLSATLRLELWATAHDIASLLIVTPQLQWGDIPAFVERTLCAALHGFHTVQ